VESAMQDIENMKQAALVDLKNQTGQMAIEIAEKVLQKQLANNTEQLAFAKSLAEQIKI
jgi:F-type H+-transporting ATPase subunit b